MSCLITRPMKGDQLEDFSTLEYPVLATPKLDGIRCLMVGGKALTANFKPIPNLYVREKLQRYLPDGMDGELMLRNTPRFEEISGAFRRKDGEPDFVFHVFDWCPGALTVGYEARVERLKQWYKTNCPAYIREWLEILRPTRLRDGLALAEFEHDCLMGGHEGVMVRRPDGPYKCGRSTLKEQYLLKIKPFEDAEAQIIGFEEEMENLNTAKKDELGRTKRSSHKANKRGKGVLGAFLVRDLKTGAEFTVGSGLTAKQRSVIWFERDHYLGATITYKFQRHGMKGDVPRSPVFKSMRWDNE